MAEMTVDPAKATCPCGTEEEMDKWYTLLKCSTCAQMYHPRCIPNVNGITPYLGDPFFHIECKNCNGNKFVVQRLTSTWKEKIAVVLFNLSKLTPNLATTYPENGVELLGFPREKITQYIEKNWAPMMGSTPFSQNQIASMKATIGQKFARSVDGKIIISATAKPMTWEDVPMVKSGTFERKADYDIDENGGFKSLYSTGRPKIDFTTYAKALALSTKTPDSGVKKRKPGEKAGSYMSKSAKINSLEFRKSLPPMRLGMTSADAQKAMGLSPADSPKSSNSGSPKSLARESTSTEQNVAKKARIEKPQTPTPKPQDALAQSPNLWTSNMGPSGSHAAPIAAAPPTPTPAVDIIARKTPSPTEQNPMSSDVELQLRKELENQALNFRSEIDELRKMVLDLKSSNDKLTKATSMTSSAIGLANGSGQEVAVAESSPITITPRRWVGSDIGKAEAWAVAANKSESQVFSSVLRERDMALMMTQQAKEVAESAVAKAREIFAGKEKMEEALRKAEKERDAAIAGRLKQETECNNLRTKVKFMSNIIIKNKSAGAAGGAPTLANGNGASARFEYKPRNVPEHME